MIRNVSSMQVSTACGSGRVMVTLENQPATADSRARIAITKNILRELKIIE